MSKLRGTGVLTFEWDRTKNQTNLQKHGVSFELASLLFQDPFSLSIPDVRFIYPEEGWLTIGLVRDIVLYVAHTAEEHEDGHEKIRIISARKATLQEQKRYYANRQA